MEVIEPFMAKNVVYRLVQIREEIEELIKELEISSDKELVKDIEESKKDYSWERIAEDTGKVCEGLKNKSKLKEMAKRGREKIENEFTWEKVAKKEERIFRVALEEFE